jgi:hypothetical protein
MRHMFGKLEDFYRVTQVTIKHRRRTYGTLSVSPRYTELDITYELDNIQLLISSNVFWPRENDKDFDNRPHICSVDCAAVITQL